MKLRTITHCSLLIALSVILARLFGIMIPIAGVGAIRFSFGELPVMLAGLIFGPLAGLVVGGIGDLVGYLVNSGGGPYFPLFTISAALTGVLPPLLVRKSEGFPTLGQTIFAVTVTGLVCSVGLNTLFLHLLYGKGLWVLLPPRLISRIILTPIHSLILFQLGKQYHAFLEGGAGELWPRKG